MRHTRDGNVTQSFICLLGVQEVVDNIDIEELPTNDWGTVLKFEVIECSRKFQWLWIGGVANFTVSILARRWKDRHV